ncbi:MAG: hypothetical protein ACOCQQ_03630 [Candidatus Nanoarchaeia archaeon]
MNKLAQLIKELPYEELRLLKKDVDAGHVKKLVNKYLQVKKQQQKTQCPVCGNIVTRGKGYHIEFGSPSLRKEATFDGPDCLAYFLEERKRKQK